MQVLKAIMQVPVVTMKVPGTNNAGPVNDNLWAELMLEAQETLLENSKENNKMLGCSFIMSEFFIYE